MRGLASVTNKGARIVGAKRAGSYSTFERRYQPVNDEGGSLRIFSWEELVYAAEGHPVKSRNVWTIIQGDNTNQMYIVCGIHYVNREGYVLTEIEWPDSEQMNIGYVW